MSDSKLFVCFLISFIVPCVTVFLYAYDGTDLTTTGLTIGSVIRFCLMACLWGGMILENSFKD